MDGEREEPGGRRKEEGSMDGKHGGKGESRTPSKFIAR